MDTLVPVKTFQIQLPVAFAADQLLPDQAVEFNFTGRAGQLLRVKVDQPYRLQIQPPGDSNVAVGGGSTDGWLYGLPKAGAYRVLYAPWKTASGIEFDFVPDDDPLADPGIKPEQLSIDFGAFAKKEDLAIAPFSLNEDEDYWDSWPTHLAVAHRGFEFRIMTVAGNKKVFRENERMTALAAALHGHGRNVDLQKLPNSIYGEAGLNFSTRPQYFEGEGWRGLRWIASYGQDIGCWFDDSAYVFEGISSNGRFFVLMRSPVSNPELTGKLVLDCREPKGMANRETEKAFKNGVSAMFDKAVSAADPATFQPNLDQLDAVIRSMKLKP